MARRRRALWLALAVSALAGLAATPAVAVIVPGRSAAGVRLGMTGHVVKGLLGKPAARGVDPTGTITLEYPKRHLTIAFLRGHAIAVYAGSRAERTSSGVGPGSTLRALRARLHGEHCGHYPHYGLACRLGSTHGRATVFQLAGSSLTDGARVTQVVVARHFGVPA